MHAVLLPWNIFKILAVTTNEVLLLAIQVIAEIVTRSESSAGTGQPFDEYAMAPFTAFVRKPWWEVAKAPTGSDADVLRESLHDLCEKTSALLKQSFDIVAGGKREALIDKVNAELVGSIVGTFEQNNVGIRCRSPLRPWADQVVAQAKAGEPQALIEIATQLMKLEDMVREPCEDEEDHHHEEGDEEHHEEGAVAEEEVDVEDPETIESLIDLVVSTEDSEIDPLFTPLDGTALFSTTCMMNHSCNPNVLITFVDAPGASTVTTGLPQSSSPLQVEVIALRDIDPGEELCFSYISTDLSSSERTQALLEYDIRCECDKCI